MPDRLMDVRHEVVGLGDGGGCLRGEAVRRELRVGVPAGDVGVIQPFPLPFTVVVKCLLPLRLRVLVGLEESCFQICRS